MANVYAAMSGGVDSSAAALLAVRAGDRVTAAAANRTRPMPRPSVQPWAQSTGSGMPGRFF